MVTEMRDYMRTETLFLCFISSFFQLARATVRDPKTGVLTTANYRISKR